MFSEKKIKKTSNFAHCRSNVYCPSSLAEISYGNCVSGMQGHSPARKKVPKIVQEIAKKRGKTIWNSTRRTIETQSWLAERFKKAVDDAEPIVLAPREAQKIEKTIESDVGASFGAKFKSEWKGLRRHVSARNLLSLRPEQPQKFFNLPNFAEQSPDMSILAHANHWKDICFFYVDKNLFKPKNSWAVLNSFFSI